MVPCCLWFLCYQKIRRDNLYLVMVVSCWLQVSMSSRYDLSGCKRCINPRPPTWPLAIPCCDPPPYLLASCPRPPYLASGNPHPLTWPPVLIPCDPVKCCSTFLFIWVTMATSPAILTQLSLADFIVGFYSPLDTSL